MVALFLAEAAREPEAYGASVAMEFRLMTVIAEEVSQQQVMVAIKGLVLQVAGRMFFFIITKINTGKLTVFGINNGYGYE